MTFDDREKLEYQKFDGHSFFKSAFVCFVGRRVMTNECIDELTVI